MRNACRRLAGGRSNGRPGAVVEGGVSQRDASEHWCSSGFANTDLDLQLKKHGVHQLIVIGLIAHLHQSHRPLRGRACLRRHGSERRDGRLSDEMMHAALDINIPNYASAIVTTKEVVDSISSLLSA